MTDGPDGLDERLLAFLDEQAPGEIEAGEDNLEDDANDAAAFRAVLDAALLHEVAVPEELSLETLDIDWLDDVLEGQADAPEEVVTFAFNLSALLSPDDTQVVAGHIAMSGAPDDDVVRWLGVVEHVRGESLLRETPEANHELLAELREQALVDIALQEERLAAFQRVSQAVGELLATALPEHDDLDFLRATVLFHTRQRLRGDETPVIGLPENISENAFNAFVETALRLLAEELTVD